MRQGGKSTNASSQEKTFTVVAMISKCPLFLGCAPILDGQDGHYSNNSLLKRRMMKYTDAFIRAYHDFKKTVDLTKSGILPELDDLVWCMLMGVPKVPADEESSEGAQITAIEQRVAILKAVFVEANRNQSEDFIDRGLRIYDQAGKLAKILLKEAD